MNAYLHDEEKRKLTLTNGLVVPIYVQEGVILFMQYPLSSSAPPLCPISLCVLESTRSFNKNEHNEKLLLSSPAFGS